MTALFTRDQIFDLIGGASLSGYLGLFVGTGFSKAATAGSAPSFEELIRNLIRRLNLGVDIDADPAYHRKSFPQVVSSLERELASSCKPPERAGERLREEVASICNLTSDPLLSGGLSGALQRLKPSWVITTNYDLILEMLLEEAVSTLPDEPLVARPDRVPIFHLHGHRLSPTSIKITEEDYVSLLGPIDYQRLKLPLILLESTTVMLGYSLGDINVRAAMAWSSSFRGTHGVRLAPGQGLVIQALYKPGGILSAPYLGANGECILEIYDIAAFLEELAERRDHLAASLASARESIERFLLDPSMAVAVGSPGPERATFLQIIERALPFAQATRFIDFLNRSLDPIWDNARKDYGFDYYDVYLQLLIDILSRIEIGQCNPALLSYLADALDRVGWYIDPAKPTASAWGATDTWQREHSRISPGLKMELTSYAETNQRTGLSRMLKFV